MVPFIVFSVVSLVGLIIFLGIFLPIQLTNAKYRTFVNEHSLAVKKIKEIAERYTFLYIPNYDMSQSYDNERYYDNISPRDYLTYELQFIKDEVKEAMVDTEANFLAYKRFEADARKECVLGRYDVEPQLKDRELLAEMEEKAVHDSFPSPTIKFSIYVKLTLTKINGVRRASKDMMFNEGEIRSILADISKRKGHFYTDPDTYKAITRVERGKVSNKMRFAVYKRDGYRCRKCGSKKNLEVDHIIPIAKGGKTTMDNLQTLCHRCNQAKGSKIE